MLLILNKKNEFICPVYGCEALPLNSREQHGLITTCVELLDIGNRKEQDNGDNYTFFRLSYGHDNCLELLRNIIKI
jgi:hypothetical protein